jgi:hypothetical protein
MLDIQRTNLLRKRYAVSDGDGAITEWQGRGAFGTVEADVVGTPVAVRAHGRKRFVLTRDGAELGFARRQRRTWEIAVDGQDYVLARRSFLRSARELRRADGSVAGSVARVRGGKRLVRVETEDDLSPLAQTFVGFITIALMDRETRDAAAGAAIAGGAATSG